MLSPRSIKEKRQNLQGADSFVGRKTHKQIIHNAIREGLHLQYEQSVTGSQRCLEWLPEVVTTQLGVKDEGRRLAGLPGGRNIIC